MKYVTGFEGKENRCLHAFCHDSTSIHSLSAPTVEWIASWIAHHFLIVFTISILANTTSTLIGVEGDGEPQRLHQHWKHPNGIQWCHFQLHISHKVAKPVAKLISQSCWITASCLLVKGKMAPSEDYPDTCGKLTSLRDKVHQKQPGQLLAPMPAWIIS